MVAIPHVLTSSSPSTSLNQKLTRCSSFSKCNKLWRHELCRCARALKFALIWPQPWLRDCRLGILSCGPWCTVHWLHRCQGRILRMQSLPLSTTSTKVFLSGMAISVTAPVGKKDKSNCTVQLSEKFSSRGYTVHRHLFSDALLIAQDLNIHYRVKTITGEMFRCRARMLEKYGKAWWLVSD